MKRRKGQILAHALISVCVLMTVSVFILQWGLHVKTLRARIMTKETGMGDLEGTRARVWACLADNGYPSGACAPTAAQSGCVPAGINAQFSGVPPDCRVAFARE